MAPRAADAQTQEALSGVDHDFVEGVLTGLPNYRGSTPLMAADPAVGTE